MHLPPVTSSPAPLAAPYGGEPGVPVGVMLLGVRVTAYAIISTAEPSVGVNPGPTQLTRIFLRASATAAKLTETAPAVLLP